MWLIVLITEELSYGSYGEKSGALAQGGAQPPWLEAGLFSARAVDTSAITNRNALISDRSLFISLTSFNKNPL